MHRLADFSLFIFVFLGCNVDRSNEARILAIVPTPSYSHQVTFRPIWRELAKRGHEIVLLTTDPMEENVENIKQIDLSFSYKIWNDYNISSLVSSNNLGNQFSFIDRMVECIFEINFKQLKHLEVQQIIHNKSETFDLLMVESLFPTHFIFADWFKVPFIGLASLDAPQVTHFLMGNSGHPVLNPDMTFGFLHPLNLWQRIACTMFDFLINIYGEYHFIPRVNSDIKSVFGENATSIVDVFRRMDMLFVNVNPIFHPIRAVTPNTISFGGGIHVKYGISKPLDKELKDFLDSAKNGVVYCSLGTNVKSMMLNEDVREMFIKTFSALPYEVLWKFEDDDLPNKPKNVMIRKWLPQREVLEHPNVKVFITQCGLQSMEEAIINHIPMVGLPFFADQPMNAKILQRKGFGVKLDFDKLNAVIFEQAIRDVATNPKFKLKVIEMADLLTDVDMTGLEKVIWWTEYVIRHKGAKAIRNPIQSLPSYQYYLLDVIGFVGIITFILIFGTVKLAKEMLNLLSNRKLKTS